jgi:hypothetical protein
MGNFLVVYQTNFANGHEDNGGFQGSLDYASSYTTFDSNDGPTSRVRHPSG